MLCWSSREEIPHTQGKRNPSKMVVASGGDRIPVELFQILKDELPKSVGAQYATGDQWRSNSRKNEGMEPKQKQYPVVHVTGNRSRSNTVKSNIA